MSEKPFRLTLLGSNSGRNAGDLAILETVIEQIARRRPGTIFEVPTTNPRFIAGHFQDRNVIPLGVMPWNLSLRLLGLPVLRSMARSDLTLILDGIIFDHRLFNPAFNFLITLVPLAPFARVIGRPMVCFEMGIGPLATSIGRRFTRLVGECCDLILVREEDSERLMREAGVKKTPIEVYADAAFINDRASNESIAAMIEELSPGGRPMAGFNLTSYGGQWVKKKLDRQAFQSEMAMVIDGFIERTGALAVLVGTQHMDRQYLEEIRGLVRWPESVRLITNVEHTPAELAGLMGRMDIFIGMRLHSLILASSVKTPVFGLTYAPKVQSFFKLLRRPELAVDLGKLEAGSLLDSLILFWGEREAEKERISPLIDGLREKAHAGFDRLVDAYL